MFSKVLLPRLFGDQGLLHSFEQPRARSSWRFLIGRRSRSSAVEFERFLGLAFSLLESGRRLLPSPSRGVKHDGSLESNPDFAGLRSAGHERRSQDFIQLTQIGVGLDRAARAREHRKKRKRKRRQLSKKNGDSQ